MADGNDVQDPQIKVLNAAFVSMKAKADQLLATMKNANASDLRTLQLVQHQYADARNRFEWGVSVVGGLWKIAGVKENGNLRGLLKAIAEIVDVLAEPLRVDVRQHSYETACREIRSYSAAGTGSG